MIVFSSVHPHTRRRCRRDGRAQTPFRCAAGLLWSACVLRPVQSMERAAAVDAMIVGEPEEAVLALAGLESFDQADAIPSITFRKHGAIVPHRSRGVFEDFAKMPFPAWDLIDFRNYTLPLVGTSLRAGRDQPRMPLLVRLLRRAASPGPQVPRARSQSAGRRDGTWSPRARPRVPLPVGRHGDAECEDVQRVLRRAHRAAAARAAGLEMRVPTI